MENNDKERIDIYDKLTPKQRFLIKLVVSIGTVIYALVELIKIIKELRND